jgi:hypothetical protein
MKLVSSNAWMLTLITVALLFGFADLAVAQTADLKGVTDRLTKQLPGVADILSIVAYLGGIGFGIKAALKLKEHNESKGQVPISQPITMAIVAALLLALPTLLTTTKSTLFGPGGTGGATLDGANMRQIK